MEDAKLNIVISVENTPYHYEMAGIKSGLREEDKAVAEAMFSMQKSELITYEPEGKKAIYIYHRHKDTGIVVIKIFNDEEGAGPFLFQYKQSMGIRVSGPETGQQWFSEHTYLVSQTNKRAAIAKLIIERQLYKDVRCIKLLRDCNI